MSENMTQLLERLAAVTEQAESAEAELLAVREDNHSMMIEIDGLRAELDALAAELAKLRNQEPVAYVDYWKSDGTGIVRKQRTTGAPLYAAPVAAPAVPAVSGELVEAGGCAPAIVTTPFIPDLDTRRNDEAFAAQQAATAPSAPEEWREVRARALSLLDGVFGDTVAGDRCLREARALLQSADHSEQALEKVAPDCRTCANRGRVNGLSQESYCDSCIYQGRDWRQNHFVDARKMVDAVKRRCEACAILPCSCK